MQRYSAFAPTGFDPAGLRGDDLEISTWFVAPVGRNRDSDTLSESNFAVALRELGGESDTVQVHRFGHWACGWFEIIVIDPADTARVAIAEELENSLADYPILDEFDHSEREYNAACAAWQHASIRERVYYCQRFRANIFAARRDDIPEDRSGELIGYLADGH